MSLGRLSRGVVLASVMCGLGTLHAASFSFSSFFTQDDQRQVITFDGPSGSVTLVTFGYAGGVNQAGQVIPAGGFDPVLSLFDATGGLNSSSNLVAFTDSTGCGGGVNQDPATLSCFDEKLVLTTLLPGNTYALVLTQSDNLPVGPTYGDGFSQDGNGNFTPSEFGCAANSFCDANIPSSARTGNWALDILGVRSAEGPTSVPEPGGPWMPAGGAGGLVLLAIRKWRVDRHRGRTMASAKARKDRP
jgi:hypothetical protein